MLGILGNIKDYFWGSREHAVEFLGTGELNKSEFKGTSNSIFFKGTREHAPPPPGRPSGTVSLVTSCCRWKNAPQQVPKEVLTARV